MKLGTMFIAVLCLSGMLFAQGTDTEIATVDDHNGWGWQSIVMQNGLVTVATVPAIGARVMQYDLGEHASIFVNPSEIGETHEPDQGTWFNYGGYKVWPAPQDRWGWPPPAQIDAAAWSSEIVDDTADSVALYVKSPKETWSKTRNISMERRTVMYKNSSRVKVEQSIINEGSQEVSWSVWDVTQSIVHHKNERDFENFWVYFPIRTDGSSLFGDDGVKTSKDSDAWVGEVAPSVYGVQFEPDGAKIFADSPEGWIAYVDEREGYAYCKVFEIWEGQEYPDGGACNEVWISGNPLYLEVEVLSPIWPIAPNGGKITFVEDWYAAKANGPVVHVNHAGLMEIDLGFDAATGNVYGLYGIFHVGTSKMVALDASGTVVAEGQTYDVSPMQKLEIDEAFELPAETAMVEVRVFDAAGAVVGAVDRVPADKVTGVDHRLAVPTGFTIQQNYPNPFNPTTTLELFLKRSQHVRVDIYNVNGERVDTVADTFMARGTHTLSWNAASLPAGVYMASVETASQRSVVKMMLLK